MRTDTHRPSAINPAEYEYVAPEHIKIQGFGDCAYVLEMRRRIQEHMARTGGTYAYVATTGNCQVCGNANAIYTVLFYHRPSNTYIRTGQECADKLDMGYNRNEINLFHTAIKQDGELKAGKRKALALLTEAGIARAFELSQNAELRQAALVANQFEERTIIDIVDKVVRYGSISEKQAGFVASLLARIDNRAAVAAQRAAEAEKAAPVPTGRVTITGTVLAVKQVEREAHYYGDSGVSTKLLIRADEGFKVWGNRFINLEKGDRVTFTATLQPSKDDPKFGFYKRPVKFLDKDAKRGLKTLQHVMAHIHTNEAGEGWSELNEIQNQFLYASEAA